MKLTRFDTLYNHILNEENTFNAINKQAFFDTLITQILNDSLYQKCTNEIFDIIQTEGLDEEFNKFKKSDWTFITLQIPENISNKIKNFDNEILNLLNEFDMIIKNRFKMKYIDLIDYDLGKIRIIKQL
jgi:hypothetical protein